MNKIGCLPHWFDEDAIANKLFSSATAFTQSELETLVEFYSNYRYNGNGYWEAYIAIKGIHASIKYYRIEGVYVYEQPVVTNQG